MLSSNKSPAKEDQNELRQDLEVADLAEGIPALDQLEDLKERPELPHADN